LIVKKEVVKSRKEMDNMTLTNGYEKSSLMFMKYDNSGCKRRGKI
jgi:hypothetical protein